MQVVFSCIDSGSIEYPSFDMYLIFGRLPILRGTAVSFLCFASRPMVCWLLIRSNTRDQMIVLLYPVPVSHEGQ